MNDNLKDRVERVLISLGPSTISVIAKQLQDKGGLSSQEKLEEVLKQGNFFLDDTGRWHLGAPDGD